MKTAIYIEDGIVQLVITPESEFEKNAMTMFHEKPLDAKLFSGSFYDCRGGWTRQAEFYRDLTRGGRRTNEDSLILRIGKTLANP